MLSATAAEYLLDHYAKVQSFVAAVNANKEAFYAYCRDRGIRYFPSAGNFVSYEVDSAERYLSFMAERRVFLRDRSAYFDGEFVRATMRGEKLQQNSARPTVLTEPQLLLRRSETFVSGKEEGILLGNEGEVMDAVSERHSPPSKFRAIRRRAVEDRMFIVDWLFFITIILAIASTYYWKDEIGPSTLSRLRFYVAFTLAMAFVILGVILAAQSPAPGVVRSRRPLSFSVLDALAAREDDLFKVYLRMGYFSHPSCIAAATCLFLLKSAKSRQAASFRPLLHSFCCRIGAELSFFSGLRRILACGGRAIRIHQRHHGFSQLCNQQCPSPVWVGCASVCAGTSASNDRSYCCPARVCLRANAFICFDRCCSLWLWPRPSKIVVPLAVIIFRVRSAIYCARDEKKTRVRRPP